MYHAHNNNNSALRSIEQKLRQEEADLRENDRKIQHIQNQLSQVEHKIKALEREQQTLNLELSRLMTARVQITKTIADEERHRADVLNTSL